MSDQKEEQKAAYRVLARKYRPQSFEELIGQDALVQTLRNAISSGRIAHAFMLTGVRGVGKTTTARIIAKALNYAGPDGSAQATTGDTGDCPICQAISEDRHPDVIEMDAASRTGVDDVREILDGVRYAPTEARYKVYIIDEVHMLSKQAFNALLKTLEEPPEHVKFIFATTEIRKVPITVLSRCQRFDLRRVDIATLAAHFANICEKEEVKAEPEALQLVARAADGSVRDGLSILDQAIAMGDGHVTVPQLENMLGLADQSRSLDVLDAVLSGKLEEALKIADDMFMAGGDPAVLLQDIQEHVHRLSRAKAVGVAAAESVLGALSPDIKARTEDMAARLSMGALGKTWQLLLKGMAEVQMAGQPRAAAEMVLIRMGFAADLPDPRDLVRRLGGGDNTQVNNGLANNGRSGSGAEAAKGAPLTGGAGDARTGQGVQANIGGHDVGGHDAGGQVSMQGAAGGMDAPMAHAGSQGGAYGSGAQAALASAPSDRPALRVVENHEPVMIQNLQDIVKLLEQAGLMILASEVYNQVELITLKSGVLKIGVREHAQTARLRELQAKLSDLSGQRWVVSMEAATGQPTLAELEKERVQKLYDNVLAMPGVQDILQAFPGAKLAQVIEPDQD